MTQLARVLIVDLNNFATFPTLAIGILVSALRRRGHQVSVLCPLAHGVPARERESQEGLIDHIARRVHLSTHPMFMPVRNAARSLRRWWHNKPNPTVIDTVEAALDRGTDIVLLSAYLQHYPTVRQIAELARRRKVPVLLGGPLFNLPEVSESWAALPGLTAVMGAEADLNIADVVDTIHSAGDVLRYAGVALPDGRVTAGAAPLRGLDDSPIPDFSDFPWDRYRLRVVPLMAGRGCQWSKCVFCSDVVSANGRTFRTRSLDSISKELAVQSERYQTRNFLFLDLKLNSDPFTWRGIIDRIQSVVPGASWIGTVHVDGREDNGLSLEDLRAAVGSGMKRVSFGLESGSQRLLDRMRKGSTVEACSRFIRDAHAAGLSVRCTMFKGFPGETAADLEMTAEFLEEHVQYLDRVRFNEFSVNVGTPMYQDLRSTPSMYPELRVKHWDSLGGAAHYVHRNTSTRAYRAAKARVLRAVYRINSRAVRETATAFDGLM